MILDMEMSRPKKPKKPPKEEVVRFTIRMPMQLSNRLETLLRKKPWINRTAWILDVIMDKVAEELR